MSTEICIKKFTFVTRACRFHFAFATEQVNKVAKKRMEHDFIGFIRERKSVGVLNSIRNFKTKSKNLGASLATRPASE